VAVESVAEAVDAVHGVDQRWPHAQIAGAAHHASGGQGAGVETAAKLEGGGQYLRPWLSCKRKRFDVKLK